MVGKGLLLIWRQRGRMGEEDIWFVIASLTEATLTVWDRPSVNSSSQHSGGKVTG